MEISLLDGKVYESTPEKIQVNQSSLSTAYETLNEKFTDAEGAVITQPFVKLYANTILPSSTSPTYLRWSVEEAYLLSPTDFPDPFGVIPPPCFIVQNADPQRIVLYNGLEFPTEVINRQLIASRIIDFSFQERHYFTSYQTSLTKEAHEYWRKVNILANQVGSIFDTPPAEITGNIINENNNSEKTVGYFQAVNETYDRFFLLPSFLPFFIGAEVCTFNGSFNPNDYPARCIDCLTLRNSSFTRPEWF